MQWILQKYWSEYEEIYSDGIILYLFDLPTIYLYNDEYNLKT